MLKRNFIFTNAKDILCFPFFKIIIQDFHVQDPQD